MDFIMEHFKGGLLFETILYILVALVIFTFAILLIDKITPFSVRKEIVEDQNVALGIIIGSVIIGIAIILGSAIG